MDQDTLIRNERVVRTLIDRVSDQGDLDLIDDLVTAD